MYSELHAQVIQSSSIRPIVLRLLPLILFVTSDASHSLLFVSVLYDVTGCVRMSNRHLLIFFNPGFLRHISCTSLNPSSFLLSDSLSLSDSGLVCFHPGFSCQSYFNNSSDSLSEFILTWFCRLSLPNKQRISLTTSHVSVSFNIRIQDVEFTTLSFHKFIDQRFFADLLLPICLHSKDLSCPTSVSYNSTLGDE